MNDTEQLENMMNFVTITSENTLKMLKEVKDMNSINEIKLTVAEYCLKYNNNLRELLKAFGKVKENGSTEH